MLISAVRVLLFLLLVAGVEVGNVPKNSCLRVERPTQKGDIERDIVPGHGHGSEFDLATVRNGPHIGALFADVGGDQRLAGAQGRAGLLQRRWLRVDQLGVIREAGLDLLRQRGAGTSQLLDAGPQVLGRRTRWVIGQ